MTKPVINTDPVWGLEPDHISSSYTHTDGDMSDPYPLSKGVVRALAVREYLASAYRWGDNFVKIAAHALCFERHCMGSQNRRWLNHLGRGANAVIGSKILRIDEIAGGPGAFVSDYRRFFTNRNPSSGQDCDLNNHMIDTRDLRILRRQNLMRQLPVADFRRIHSLLRPFMPASWASTFGMSESFDAESALYGIEVYKKRALNQRLRLWPTHTVRFLPQAVELFNEFVHRGDIQGNVRLAVRNQCMNLLTQRDRFMLHFAKSDPLNVGQRFDRLWSSLQTTLDVGDMRCRVALLNPSNSGAVADVWVPAESAPDDQVLATSTLVAPRVYKVEDIR